MNVFRWLTGTAFLGPVQVQAGPGAGRPKGLR